MTHLFALYKILRWVLSAYEPNTHTHSIWPLANYTQKKNFCFHRVNVRMSQDIVAKSGWCKSIRKSVSFHFCPPLHTHMRMTQQKISENEIERRICSCLALLVWFSGQTDAGSVPFLFSPPLLLLLLLIFCINRTNERQICYVIYGLLWHSFRCHRCL